MALFAAILMSILICGKLCAVSGMNPDADTNAKRVEFIKSLGVTINDETASTKGVIIPESFSDVYRNYNEIQKSAGYDLSAYKGCEVVIYTYSISPPDGYRGTCSAHLIVYKGRVIGGDISSTELGGFMLPLDRIKK